MTQSIPGAAAQTHDAFVTRLERHMIGDGGEAAIHELATLGSHAERLAVEALWARPAVRANYLKREHMAAALRADLRAAQLAASRYHQ